MLAARRPCEVGVILLLLLQAEGLQLLKDVTDMASFFGLQQCLITLVTEYYLAYSPCCICWSNAAHPSLHSHEGAGCLCL